MREAASNIDESMLNGRHSMQSLKNQQRVKNLSTLQQYQSRNNSRNRSLPIFTVSPRSNSTQNLIEMSKHVSSAYGEFGVLKKENTGVFQKKFSMQ